MELRHLRYFLALAEELNFTRAAERMRIAQPPFSKQIRDLEIELGVTLFERTKRRVTITKAGIVFLKEVKLVMRQIDQAVTATTTTGNGEEGQLVIGFNSSASHSVLPAVLHQFQKNYPQIDLVLKELTTTQQLAGLNSGQIDIGLLYLPIKNPGLITTSIQAESLLLVLPSNHNLAKQSSVTLQMLAQELFISVPSAKELQRQIQKTFWENKFQPEKSQEVLELHTALNLVASGIGVTLVPSSIKSLRREGVVYKILAESRETMELGGAWRMNNKSPVLLNFLLSIEKFTLERMEKVGILDNFNLELIELN
jgi:DNA-binding transcriptional LysR family regulator